MVSTGQETWPKMGVRALQERAWGQIWTGYFGNLLTRSQDTVLEELEAELSGLESRRQDGLVSALHPNPLPSGMAEDVVP